ncbi:hypothetical protein [Antarctobacter sp.]|uniref:hypothetical protein n=1 Tax=Antarctobacter sp. TaxID=1872577 RepID=UPI003A8DFDB7
MKPQRRFIASITATAKAGAPRLPFERGAPRTEMISRRTQALQPRPATAKRA